MNSNPRCAAGSSTRAPAALALLLTLLLAAALPARADRLGLVAAGWGGGGRFTALAVDPADPNLVVAGSDVAGYFVSRDGGDSFKPLGAGLQGLAVSGLAFDPARPGTLAVQTDEGLYLSRDGGTSLVRLGDLGYAERFFGGGALLPFGEELAVATPDKGVFAVSWREAAPKIKPLPGLEGKKVNALALFDGRLHAASNRGAFTLGYGRFAEASAGLGSGKNLTDMAATPETGLFAVEEKSGLWRFDPAKNAWERPGPLPSLPSGADGPVRFKALALDPKTPGRIFIATHPEYWPYLLFVSEDGGKRFAPVTDFALDPAGPPNYPKGLESVETLGFSPDGQTVFLADWWNLWRSRDGGKRFAQLHKGLQNTVVYALAEAPGQLLAATADNGLMVSTDDGAHWARSANGLPDGHVRDVRVSPKNPDKRYVLLEPWQPRKREGRFALTMGASRDGGASWEVLETFLPARPLPQNADGRPTLLVIDPADDDVVYLGTNGRGLFRVNVPALAAGDPAAVEDLGRTLPVPAFFGPQSLLAPPEPPGTLLAATVGGGLWRSKDGGRLWLPAADPRLYAFCLAADPANPAHILAGLAEKRLLESLDGGKTWRERDLPGERPPHVAVQSLAFDPARPGLMVAGTAAYDLKAADGLYLSRDGAKTFAKVPSETAPVNVTTLGAGKGGMLVGFNGLGVYRLSIGP